MSVQDAKTFAIGLEPLFGVVGAVDHPLETLPSSKGSWTPNRVQGQGMRAGSQFARSNRRVEVSADGKLNLDVEALSKGQSLLWKFLMGASTSSLVSGSTYQVVHTRATTVLPSATIQKAIQTVDGTPRPETYFGCTCSDWELSFDNNALVKLVSNWDAANLSTAPTSISTTLSALSAIGATSVSTVATVPVGAAITINSLESRVVTSVTGVGPYVLGFTKPLTGAYASAAPVAVVGYTAPSYPAAANLFSFASAMLYTGTVTAPTATALGSGLTPLAVVRSGSISVANSLLDGRYLAGGGGRKEQQKPGAPVGKVKLQAEFVDLTLRDATLADTPTTLVLTLTAGTLTAGLETLQVIVSEMKPNPDMPDSDGTDVGLMDLEYDILDNLTAAQAIWVVQRTSDSIL